MNFYDFIYENKNDNIMNNSCMKLSLGETDHIRNLNSKVCFNIQYINFIIQTNILI